MGRGIRDQIQDIWKFPQCNNIGPRLQHSKPRQLSHNHPVDYTNDSIRSIDIGIRERQGRTPNLYFLAMNRSQAPMDQSLCHNLSAKSAKLKWQWSKQEWVWQSQHGLNHLYIRPYNCHFFNALDFWFNRAAVVEDTDGIKDHDLRYLKGSTSWNTISNTAPAPDCWFQVHVFRQDSQQRWQPRPYIWITPSSAILPYHLSYFPNPDLPPYNPHSRLRTPTSTTA